MKKIGVENFYIELVEEYPCENIEQLRAREGHFIRERGTLNKAIAGRTQQEYGKEWRDNNREYAILKSKEWRNNNKELAILQSQKWRDTLDNKEKSQEYAKKYHQQHKETIRAKKNFKNNCVCGGQFTNANKIQHDKTKKHQEYINSLQN